MSDVKWQLCPYSSGYPDKTIGCSHCKNAGSVPVEEKLEIASLSQSQLEIEENLATMLCSLYGDHITQDRDGWIREARELLNLVNDDNKTALSSLAFNESTVPVGVSRHTGPPLIPGVIEPEETDMSDELPKMKYDLEAKSMWPQSYGELAKELREEIARIKDADTHSSEKYNLGYCEGLDRAARTLETMSLADESHNTDLNTNDVLEEDSPKASTSNPDILWNVAPLYTPGGEQVAGPTGTRQPEPIYNEGPDGSYNEEAAQPDEAYNAPSSQNLTGTRQPELMLGEEMYIETGSSLTGGIPPSDCPGHTWQYGQNNVVCIFCGIDKISAAMIEFDKKENDVCPDCDLPNGRHWDNCSIHPSGPFSDFPRKNKTEQKTETQTETTGEETISVEFTRKEAEAFLRKGDLTEWAGALHEIKMKIRKALGK